MSVNPQDVIDIMDTDLSLGDIDPFLSDVKDKFPALNDQAAKWFAAHLVSMKDQRKSKESVGPVSVTYEGKTGMGIESTRYGSMALIFDTNDILKNLDKDDTVFEVY